MLRLFDTSTKRDIKELSRKWRLIPDFDNSGNEKGYCNGLPSDARYTFVPSCWNFELDLFHHYGYTWYETEFEAMEDNVMLVFGAVNNFCDVYVDGKHVAYHYGAFCEFKVDLPAIGKGKHLLVLKVGAELNMTDSIPSLNTDWFNYGGIIRPVEVHSIKNCKLDFYTEYDLDVENKSATLDVFTSIKLFDGDISDTLKITIDGKSVYEEKITVSGETTVKAEIKLNDLRLWDIGQGNLYTVSVEFGGDQLIDRIGFRKMTSDRQGFILNGRRIKLRGVNRHEENVEFGFAVTPNQVKRDIAIIKDMGCNIVRGSHYPNAKTTLDMLDEEGLLFWEEIPMWGFVATSLELPVVAERAVNLHKDMIARDRNHPCIVIWGLLNEAETHKEPAVPLMAKLLETVKSLDTTRLITFASNHAKQDLCFDFVDFISINTYPGWYGRDYRLWAEEVKEFRDYADSVGAENKCLIISEFGAGAIKGDTSFDGMIWSETYQNDYFEFTLPCLCDHPDVAGTIIWQYCDMRTSEKRDVALKRPRNYNNKGLLDEHRNPKMAYFTAKRAFNERKEK